MNAFSFSINTMLMRFAFSLLTLGSAILLIITATGIPTANAQITVMSYNVRYANPNDAPNNWDNRKERVATLIQFYEPAFVGTQEALFHQLEDLAYNLHSYRWIGKGRKDGKREGEFSAILYDTTKVKLVAGSDSTIWLSKTPDVPSKNWDAALPRILTWAKFKLKSSGRHLFVFNTHFDHVGDTARLESAKIIIETIQRIAGDNPVVLTGDFNITDDTEPYHILNSSFLTDAYTETTLPPIGPIFTFNGFSVADTSNQNRIDYLFTNDQVDVLKYAVIAAFKNGYYPSDHLPVLTVLELNQ